MNDCLALSYSLQMQTACQTHRCNKKDYGKMFDSGCGFEIGRNGYKKSGTEPSFKLKEFLNLGRLMSDVYPGICKGLVNFLHLKLASSPNGDDNPRSFSTSPDENSMFNFGFVPQSIAAQRLHTELKKLSQFPLQGCQAFPSSENIFQWTAVIDGPKDTAYEKGTFFVQLNFSTNYPFVAPDVLFLTRIYHCNISNQGKVRLQVTSRRGWKPSFGVSTVLQSLISLLYACDPHNSLVPSIGEQYLQQPEEFSRIARTWTERFAQ